jgi:hypothetical protein
MIPEDTPVGKDNCGIATVAMLAGTTYSETERLFIDLFNKRETTTMWERMDVIRLLGLTVQEEIHYKKKPMLSAWLSTVYDPRYDYHVSLTGHAIALRKNMLYDQVYTKGITPLLSPYKRKHISAYLRIGEKT